MMIWHCFRVATGSEKSVRDDAIALGMGAVAPIDSYEAPRNGRMRVVERIMLPGYVIVGFSGHEDWPEIFAFPDVHNVLRSIGDNAKPAVLSDALVDAVRDWPRQLADERRRAAAHASLRVGQVVEIEDGPLIDWRGTVSKIAGGRAMLDLIGGRQVSVATRSVRIVETVSE